MQYWLFKTEPDVFGIDDLARAPDQTARWDEIRNYQARNFLRDEVRVGDQVFIYHSSCKQVGIAGVAEVVRGAYPDPSQFEPSHALFDVKAAPGSPRWFCVDIRLRECFSQVIPLRQIKATAALADMTLVRQGRLSVQPVSAAQWQLVLKLR
ncbi:EVE domain-containing protein [Marinobacterium aestuarii]|uniref:EVE domain-containing protein n=1 Tax=Marinobacterium aestuarii TaxID=1821621 RepID=A0A1A9EWY4_9GAMM|nr:EVE domain-containing protein [Marinobacterium aestuarii]ANG62178.1 EVE domain-containing protein [Marinobacterium aestuarii]